jgi:hypothetical protein
MKKNVIEVNLKKGIVGKKLRVQCRYSKNNLRTSYDRFLYVGAL